MYICILQISVVLLQGAQVAGWSQLRISRSHKIPATRNHDSPSQQSLLEVQQIVSESVTSLSSTANKETSYALLDDPDKNIDRKSCPTPLQRIIHWRGEKEHGNSLQFRQLEFKSALQACQMESKEGQNRHAKFIDFAPALSSNFKMADKMSDYERHSYENAMQFVDFKDDDDDNDDQGTGTYSNKLLMKTVQRCSLIRSMYEIVAEGDTYQELAKNALDSGNLQDMISEDGTSASASWRVSMRQYGEFAKGDKQKQYGKNMRSPLGSEREAINQMGDLFAELKGPVDLKNADVNLYLFEGLVGKQKVLARVLTRGAKSSIIAPKTRICVTNTPLCPLAAFTMCNVAQVKSGDSIFDPFAGSCAILLAASMIEPTVNSVGCEIAHNGQVNRENIMKDFMTRDLTAPSAIIRGDSMEKDIRNEARAAIGNAPFDAIITDPPYGIREKTGFCLDPPLINLVKCIAKDRAGGDSMRLLKVGGRLVAFVPNQEGDDISADMPTQKELSLAGLEFVQMLEQPLNDSLSRWLVEYVCIE